MRRLIAFAGLVGSFVLIGFTGWGDASVTRAHATSTAPLSVLKAKDGETLALARVVVHGHVFLFLIDTGPSKTLVDDALARKLHLTTVGRPIKVTGVGCSEAAREGAAEGLEHRRPAPSEYHRHQVGHRRRQRTCLRAAGAACAVAFRHDRHRLHARAVERLG